MNRVDQVTPANPPPHDPSRPWEWPPATVNAWTARFPRLLARAPAALDAVTSRSNPARPLDVGVSMRVFLGLAGSVFRDYERLTSRPMELGLAMLDRMEARAALLPDGPTDGWPEWVVAHAPAFMDPAEDVWFDRWREMSLFEAAVEIRRFDAEWGRLGPAIRDEPPSVGGWVNLSTDPRAAISRRFALAIELAAAPLPPTEPYTLARLTGSPDQVKWATTIRAERWPQVEQYAWPRAFDPAIPNVARVPYGHALHRLAMESEAKAWIDQRSRSAPQLVEPIAKSYKIAGYPYALDAETVSAAGGVERLLAAARARRTSPTANPPPAPGSTTPEPCVSISPTSRDRGSPTMTTDHRIETERDQTVARSDAPLTTTGAPERENAVRKIIRKPPRSARPRPAGPARPPGAAAPDATPPAPEVVQALPDAVTTPPATAPPGGPPRPDVATAAAEAPAAPAEVPAAPAGGAAETPAPGAPRAVAAVINACRVIDDEILAALAAVGRGVPAPVRRTLTSVRSRAMAALIKLGDLLQ